MKVEPAHVDQVQSANGRFEVISSDVGNVAADLKRIDPHLGVRFAATAQDPFWAVYWQSDDQRETYLVLTAKAYKNRLGVWEGLDQRIVKRIQEIDPQNGYDFAAEVEKQNKAADEAKVQRFRDAIAAHGAEAQFALRKDLGSKSRAFI